MRNSPRKRFLSLRNRYTTNLIVAIILVVIFTVIQLTFAENIFTAIVKSHMVSEAATILTMDPEDSDYHKDISEIESDGAVYIEVYRPRDTLIYTTNSNNWVYNADANGSSELQPRIMSILNHADYDENSFFEQRREHFNSAEYLVFESTDGDTTVTLYYSMDTIADNALVSNYILLGLSALFLMGVIILIIMYKRQIVTPIEQLNDAAERISKLDFSSHLPEMTIPDLDSLRVNINKLSMSLERNMKNLQDKNKELEDDIEREKQAEELRKNFIANASHELKTPIAIIQSYAEGVKYDDTHESTDEYCDVILDEADKMTALIVRLMNMVKYNSQFYETNFESFNISENIDSALSSLNLILQEKGIDLQINVDKTLFGYGDRWQCNEVLMNYVSNAISHCAGEKKIVVSSEKVENCVRISVFNTGSHIADEDLPHLWDSFYRADKAHSRAEGRFGLGLSIVRSVQTIHNRKYGVENTADGVVFWYDILEYKP